MEYIEKTNTWLIHSSSKLARVHEGFITVFCEIYLCQTRYIMDELKDKNIEIDTSSWVVEVSDRLLLQHNGYFFLLVLITA